MKRLMLLAGALVFSACAGLDAAQTSPGAASTLSWTAVWGASPTPPPPNARTFENQTIRQVVRASTGGSRVRVRFTNEYGDKPLTIGAATISLAGADGAAGGPALPLTFGGAASLAIPQGAPMLSDPVDLTVAALGNLSISLFVPDATGPCTCHPGAYATSYVSEAGDFTRSGFTPASTFTNRAFISGVEVESAAPAIITFGDSITDGTASTVNANARWPDILADRLNAAGMTRGVSNQAIAGNRVLSHEREIFGESALTRFDRDVLSVPNARWMIILEGVNDIGMGGANPPTPEQMIAGYRQIIARAHDRGLKVYGATILPYEGARYYTEEGNAVREAVNAWMRTGGAFDGVIDLDAATRDPANPKRLQAGLQSGDWLHPNDAGYKVMGEAIDLGLFR